jgi:predicted RNA-binding protein with PIN domain
MEISEWLAILVTALLSLVAWSLKNSAKELFNDIKENKASIKENTEKIEDNTINIVKLQTSLAEGIEKKLDILIKKIM